ncbi:MAG: hypothetical protein PHF08_07460 [Candidatus Riflebacteria bacterium]|nr:hypothetical protein [Candidatus Riflebacteria bacterium]NCB45896.1 hypothetical protein [bacterium]
MEELIERVSDIIMSPVIRRNIWHFLHRQKGLISLVCFILMLFSAPLAADSPDRVSRLNFIAYVYGELYDYCPLVEEVHKLGLLEAFPDGKMHLEWPITRGIAAEALYRVSIQSGSGGKMPRAFADIPDDSPYLKALKVVGGAFLPRNRGRFEPDKLLSETHLKHAVSVLLSNRVIVKEAGKRIEMVPVFVSEKDEYADIEPLHPPIGFSEKPGSNFGYINDALAKIDVVNEMSVATQQMNPQSLSDIRSAVKAMEEVQTLFKKFGASVLELTAINVKFPGDDKALRNALSQFNNMLSDFVIRFNYCKDQLSRVTLVDPDIIKKCDILNSEIDESLRQIKILRKRISDRMSQPILKEKYQ